MPGIHPSRVARASGSVFAYVSIPKVPIVTAPRVISVPDPRLLSLLQKMRIIKIILYKIISFFSSVMIHNHTVHNQNDINSIYEILEKQ